MNTWQRLRRPPWRTLVPVALLLGAGFIGGWLWTPGLDVRDGRHDRGSNAIWLAHGWLGADSWFQRHDKTREFARYRDPERIRELAARLTRHRVRTAYPHLCPTDAEGRIAAVDAAQVERFLDACSGIDVIPWIGGPNGSVVSLGVASWRATFIESAAALLRQHPRLAGVQVNIEPLPDGDADFLKLLDELRKALPPGKRLSVAAYPPPTRWHPFPEVHWSEGYFRQVARRVDELAVMLYDTSLRSPRLYQNLMASWTEQVLAWSEGKPVLLGVPTYADEGVGYHHPGTENLTNAVLGIHRGLTRAGPADSYRGMAIYCEWETSEGEWSWLRGHFLKP